MTLDLSRGGSQCEGGPLSNQPVKGGGLHEAITKGLDTRTLRGFTFRGYTLAG